MSVTLIHSSDENFKITTAFDFKIFKMLASEK